MSLSRATAACLAALLLLLSACATRPARVPTTADPALAVAREEARARLSGWRIEGRVAVSGHGQGGSGRLEWTQQGGRYDIVLRAPVTRQGWRLSGDAAGARLEGIGGGPREDAQVERMLFEATGWDIPVRALVDWVRGIAASGAGRAEVVYGEGGLPASIGQLGWRIEYRDWHPEDGPLPALPRRIEAVRGDAKVRLVVDRWEALMP
mgnify:CR=1 FL=1